MWTNVEKIWWYGWIIVMVNYKIILILNFEFRPIVSK
jgi:hypothetical protein